MLRHRFPPLCRSFRPLASRRRSPPRRRGVAASLSLKLGLILFVHRQGVVLFVHRRGVVLLLCRSFHPPSRHRSPLRCRGVAASLCLSLIVGLGGATRKRGIYYPCFAISAISKGYWCVMPHLEESCGFLIKLI